MFILILMFIVLVVLKFSAAFAAGWSWWLVCLPLLCAVFMGILQVIVAVIVARKAAKLFKAGHSRAKLVEEFMRFR